MTKIRLSKEFNFEMAHALKDYDGLCKHIHGHSYVLRITVIGEAQKSGVKKGMVMDYKDLKALVNEVVIHPFDHALMLSKEQKNEIPTTEINLFAKTIFVNYQPTSEKMLEEIVLRIQKRLPSTIALHSVYLKETAQSWAEWHAEDNK